METRIIATVELPKTPAYTIRHGLLFHKAHIGYRQPVEVRVVKK